MRIDSEGNVGINETTPTAKLHIEAGSDNATGGIRFTNDDTGGSTATDGTALFIEQNTTDFFIRNYETAGIRMRTNDTDALYISSSQKVGIGTTSPSRILDVETDAQWYADFNTTANDGAYLSFQIDGADKGYLGSRKHLQAATSGYEDDLALRAQGHLVLQAGSSKTMLFNTNGNNTALTLGSDYNATFAGVVSFPDGSASAPSITNTGDTDTGFYFGAANEINITLAGTQQWRWSGQQLGAQTGANPGYPAYSFGTDWNTGMYLEGADILAFSTGGVKRFDLNASGNATFAGDVSVGGDELGFDGSQIGYFQVAGNKDMIFRIKDSGGRWENRMVVRDDSGSTSIYGNI